MKIILVLLVILVVCHQSDAGTCAECKTTYNDDKTKTCDSVKTYINCVFDGTGNDCKTEMEAADAARADYKPCDLTDTCTCEVALKKTEDTKKSCTERKKEITCLTKSSRVGCDGKTTSTAVANTVNDTLSKLKSCELSETCKCEKTFAIADVTTKEKNCTAAQTFQTCLTNVTVTTDTGCDGTSKDKVKTDVADKAVKDNCSGAGVLSQMTVFTFVVMLFSTLFKQ